MGTSENTSSVDTKNGDKIAAFGRQKLNEMRARFHPEEKKVEEQVINARKAKHLDSAKEKARKKAKIAKASRKKNKK